MTSEQLTEIKARWKETTPGQWIVCQLWNFHPVDPNDTESGEFSVITLHPDGDLSIADERHTTQEYYPNGWNEPPDHDGPVGLRKGDAEFIAHAHEDIPLLVAEIERLWWQRDHSR